VARAGQSSFAIVCWKSPLPSYSVIEQAVDAKPGMYKVSAYVVSDGTDQQDGFMVYVQNATGNNLVLKPVALPADQPWWKRVSLDVEVPKDGTKIGIGFAVSSKQGMIYLDDLSISGVDGKNLLKNASFEEK
jgi:hypothetical protein